MTLLHVYVAVLTVVNSWVALVLIMHGFLECYEKTKRLGLFLFVLVACYLILFSQIEIPPIVKLYISSLGIFAIGWVFILTPLYDKLVRWNKKRREDSEKEKLLREIAFWEGNSYDEAGCLSGKTINGLKAHIEKLRKD